MGKLLHQCLRHKAVWWTLFVIWLAAVFYASSMTEKEVQPYIPTFELHKLAHFIAYSSGAVILALSLRFSTQWSWKKIAWVSIAAVSVYGATDEIHQIFTPGRGPAVHDWAIDTVSGMAGTMTLRFMLAVKKTLAKSAGRRKIRAEP